MGIQFFCKDPVLHFLKCIPGSELIDQMAKLNFEEQFLVHLSDNLRIGLRGLGK